MEKLNDLTPARWVRQADSPTLQVLLEAGRLCPQPLPRGTLGEEGTAVGTRRGRSPALRPTEARHRRALRPLAAAGGAGSLRPERGSPGEHHRNQGPPPACPRCGWEEGAPRGSGAATVSFPPPGAGNPQSWREKPLLPWPLLVKRTLAVQGRDKGGGAAAARGEGPPPPATAAPRPRSCTHAQEQRRAALPCSSHSPWLKRPARQHRGRSRRLPASELPAAGQRAWDSACRGWLGTS